MMTGFGFGFGLLGMLMMVIFWVAVIALGVWLARSLFTSNSQSQKPAGSDPLNAQQILDARYARGEVTKDQYQAMKQDLREK